MSYPSNGQVNSPMTQQAYEKQYNAKTRCGGWLSTSTPAEGYHHDGGCGGCRILGGLGGIVFILSVVVAIVCLVKLNEAHGLIRQLQK